jgi:phosphate transport system ATP-binding protein
MTPSSMRGAVSDSSRLRFHIEDLTCRYDGREALSHVTLDILDGEIFVVFGPSQAGKSTLLRLLNRLNDLVDGMTIGGRILLDGEDIYAPDQDVTELRRRVGMVFALPIPLPGTIRENLTYGPRLSGIRDPQELDQRVKQSLTRAALWDEVADRLDDPAMDLSGGQQQRLCLARVLAMRSQVILLDNPTSGLDPLSTAKVEESLRDLKEDHTIVMVQCGPGDLHPASGPAHLGLHNGAFRVDGCQNQNADTRKRGCPSTARFLPLVSSPLPRFVRILERNSYLGPEDRPAPYSIARDSEWES